MKSKKNAKKFVIIVAGGSGFRMNSRVPKQFMLLKDLPVLMHTIKAFYDYSEEIEIIVVLPKKNFSTWENLCSEYNFSIPHKLAEGGKTRFYSVKNGLSLISEEGFVGIHDAVRPLVSRETISRCFESAIDSGCGIPCLLLNDTARYIGKAKSKPLNRNLIRLIQTPQCFSVRALQDAYKTRYSAKFTDDATVFEKAGGTVVLVEGNQENIKITTPMDLVVANILKNSLTRSSEVQ
jgi:2-C-methyl-D-erythritol 4-phosphate cytidylyltransferase